uniref:Uncharacterized protein n=1 Tax=viral metagenome TaxID=1070528 RepID=A0A6M3L2U6_9ZZZZ
MPTKEQIRQVESYIRKSRRQSHGHDWISLKPEMQEMLLCPECDVRIRRVLGGRYVWIYSNKSKENRMRMLTCEKLMAEGKSSREIGKILQIKWVSVAAIARRIKNRREKYGKI